MLLNKKEVRKRILAKVKQDRPGWDCTRVSEAVLIKLDLWFDIKLDQMVHSHNSTGKTFRDFI
ncbi:hypothetical protein LCGC14_1084080 [marine sediment metagenome]|uniref:Uncharacterized protein n=1 Tax=marine sediment metagenome TaxID=412755 RepID=A0A0F9MEG7_9ZZZZ